MEETTSQSAPKSSPPRSFIQDPVNVTVQPQQVKISFRQIYLVIFIIIQLVLFYLSLNLLNSTKSVFQKKEDKQYVQAYLVISTLFIMVAFLAYMNHGDWKYIILPLLWIGCVVLGGLMADSDSKKVKQLGVGIIVGYSLLAVPVLGLVGTVASQIQNKNAAGISRSEQAHMLFFNQKEMSNAQQEYLRKNPKIRRMGNDDYIILEGQMRDVDPQQPRTLRSKLSKIKIDQNR